MSDPVPAIAECPFCGRGPDVSEPFALDLGEPGQPSFRVNCAECLVYGPSAEREDEAVNAWNRRASVPTADAGLAGCPFCGSEVQARVRQDHVTGSSDRMVECTGCDCWSAFSGDSMTEAKDAWNRRRGARHSMPEQGSDDDLRRAQGLPTVPSSAPGSSRKS